MRACTTYVRSVFSMIFLIVFSCTIIEDKDITSLSELSTLKWKGVEIKQELNSGTSTTVVQLVYDSVKNVVNVNGDLIVKKMKFSLPPLSNRKMRLRSGTTANTDFYITYKSGNQPYNFWIQQGDSAVEFYRFRYSTSNVLNKIVSIMDPVDGLPPTVWTNDTLIYDTSNKLTSMIRRSPIGSPTGTITLSYEGVPSTRLSKITFISKEYNNQGGNCSNQSGTNCGSFSIFNQSQNPRMDFRFNNINTLLYQVLLTDYRVDSNNGSNSQGCCREPDTYYLHPIMLLKNQFTIGSDLMLIYMNDWWKEGGAIANQNLSKNDVVSLNFIYAP